MLLPAIEQPPYDYAHRVWAMRRFLWRRAASAFAVPGCSHAAIALARRTAAVLAGVALCVPVCAVPRAAARTTSRTQASHALTPFDKAQRQREALRGRPEQQRTRRDYNRVLDAFRAVYHNDPASPRADTSIQAVAELLAEEGRLFEDEKALRDAIGQYEFLRHEYPGSRLRAGALLTEGAIYRRDLGDRDEAKARFQEFLKAYPRSPLAEQARTELKQIRAEELAEKRGAGKSGIKAEASVRSRSGGKRTVLDAAQSQQQEAKARQSSRQAAQPAAASSTAQRPAALGAGGENNRPADASSDAKLSEAALSAPPPPRKGGLPLVTGVRHWSTSVYTRVAIDLEDEVQYEAVRVPSPDRIYFDLHGTRLSPELIGKSVEVTDDGFLKRIRAAQFSGDVTRIVLDVSDVSEYSAFLLPNPYRLIIDIHGRKAGAASQAERLTAKTAAQASGPDQTKGSERASNANQSAGVNPAAGPTAAGPNQAAAANQPASSSRQAANAKRRTQSPAASPDSVAEQKSSSLKEVASLGRQPNRVRATKHPTTAPISASVAGTTPAPQQTELAAAAPSPAENDAPESGADESAANRSSEAKPRGRRGSASDEIVPNGVHEAAPTANGQRSLVRALGLKIGRIVVDPGHGGHDSGTLGPEGIEEKDVVLDVSLRLGKLLRQRLGADVIFTRDDDTFIPLETRTAIANKARADLFLSVHANSSHDSSARGVETYYLNFTASPDALEVAARENAVSDQSIHQLSDLVKKITLKDKIDESREFAADVQQNLFAGLEDGNRGLRDRGVKKAPFVVLIGANMPSILAEISFLTNPEDARELRDPNYRQRIAESLYRGVAKYIGGLSGVKLAQSRPAR